MTKKLLAILQMLLICAMLFTGCGGEKEEPEFFYSPGNAFVTNLLDKDSLIKMTVQFSINREETALLTARNVVIRDCILRIIRNTPSEVFEAPDMQDLISDAILTELNQLFPADPDTGKPLFTRLYFDDFVMQ